ncbi:MAG: hypothetical protein K8R58_03340, partial [Bacteroidales bacterium]|nr:hypothetical protein [Bacteroidales bacterium]
GAFLYKEDNTFHNYDFTLSGSTGCQDYTYDHVFLGRFEDASDYNVLSKQFVRSDGGFAIYTPIGKTNDWLLALNLTSSLPIPKKIPLKIYVNIAGFGKTLEIPQWENHENIMYEFGAKISVIRNVFEFYFPIVMSKDLYDYSEEITDNYWQKIRFTLYLNKLNPFGIIKKLQ